MLCQRAGVIGAHHHNPLPLHVHQPARVQQRELLTDGNQRVHPLFASSLLLLPQLNSVWGKVPKENFFFDQRAVPKKRLRGWRERTMGKSGGVEGAQIEAGKEEGLRVEREW